MQLTAKRADGPDEPGPTKAELAAAAFAAILDLGKWS
jgi:hypothetical protein